MKPHVCEAGIGYPRTTAQDSLSEWFWLWRLTCLNTSHEGLDEYKDKTWYSAAKERACYKFQLPLADSYSRCKTDELLDIQKAKNVKAWKISSFLSLHFTALHVFKMSFTYLCTKNFKLYILSCKSLRLVLLNPGILRSLDPKAKISRWLGHKAKHFGHAVFPQHGRCLCIGTALCICGSTTVKWQASRSPGCVSARKARKGCGCHQLGCPLACRDTWWQTGRGA